MAAKEARLRGVIGKLREVEMVLGQGCTTAEACQCVAVSEQTYRRWRKIGCVSEVDSDSSD